MLKKMKTIKSIFFAFMVVILAQSCESELDKEPKDNRLTAEAAFEDPAAYKQFLAKLYGGLSVTGQNTTGSPDIVSDDEGASGYLRSLWKVQELPTDEAIIGWNDGDIRSLNSQTWTAGNEFTRAAYGRFFYQVALVNEFLRQTTDAKLDGRGVDAALRTEIQAYRTEARFLRALAYSHALDVFGNVPFVTEESPVGAFFPPQIERADLFDYVESELLAIEDAIAAPRANEYGRADKGAVWMLLAKLYLNAEVYIGTPKYSEALTFTNNVIGSGYTIPSNPYQHSFLADNDRNGAQNEVIFTIPFDGINTQSYGGTTFLVKAPVGGTIPFAELGINGGWGGIRTTPEFVDKFSNENFNPVTATTAIGAPSDWGLVGSGTPNGWDGPDTPMSELSANVFQGYVNLTDGEMKFRFNNDWSLNYGINPGGAPELVENGDNIPVDAGLYKITLNLNDFSYAIDLVDGRELFYSDGHNKEINEVGTFTEGFAITKWRNVDVDGNQGNDSTGEFVDIDFPMFRLADAYLMYAEIALRGGGGDLGTAVGYINEIRARAYGNAAGNITQGELTLDFILNERARELYWEGHRRTDLIRFGQYSTQGVWSWKGNVQQGTTTDAFRDLMPLPANDLGVNPNLTQNTGY